MSLAEKKCVPCEGGVPKLDPARALELLRELDGWSLEGDRIRRPLRFADFRAAMRFANRVADLAESEGHHPDILVHDWNRVDVSTSTHAIGGLSENDFILAAKVDVLARESSPRDPAR